MSDETGAPPRTTAPGRREKKAAETRQRIFLSAISLFAERGFDNVTIEQITEKADVGKGTFFNYFPNKEAVLTYFGGIQVERLQQAIVDGEVVGDPRDRVRQLIQILASYPEMTPELARALFTASLNFNRFQEVGSQGVWHMERVFADIIREGQETGVFRSTGNSEEAALFTLGLYFLALLSWCTGFTQKPLIEVARCYTDLALEGLVNPECPAPERVNASTPEPLPL
jgi:AcrR family transcriptional regulator